MLCGVVAGQNRELFDSIYTQIDAKGAAGWAVRVVVNADTVQSGVVLPGTPSRYCHLRPKSSLRLTRCLSACGCYSRLQSRNIRGGTPIQREFTHACCDCSFRG